MRSSNLKLDKKAVIFLTIGFLGFMGIAFSFLFQFKNPSGSFLDQFQQRPQYCTKGQDGANYCLDGIFTYLPEYPSGMVVVKTNIEILKYPIMENFAAVTPLCQKWSEDYSQCLEFLDDKYFYLQPEFFYQNWHKALDLYYPLTTGQGYTYVGVGGLTSFPNAIVIGSSEEGVKPGTDLKAVFYLANGWAVRNYQGLRFAPTFPSNGRVAYREVVDVNQDPNIVKGYFEINVDPAEIVLGRTFPVFETTEGCIPYEFNYQPPCTDWVRKITVTIHVKENTPAGDYLIAINPTKPSKENETRWTNAYGLRYYTFEAIGLEPPLYRIFVKVT